MSKTPKEIAESIGYYLPKKGEVTTTGAEMIKQYHEERLSELEEEVRELESKMIVTDDKQFGHGFGVYREEVLQLIKDMKE